MPPCRCTRLPHSSHVRSPLRAARRCRAAGRRRRHCRALAPRVTPALEPPGDPSQAAASPPAPTDGLSADLFYRLMLGDVALQRGETPLAARAYLRSRARGADPRHRAARHRSRARGAPARPGAGIREAVGRARSRRPSGRSRSWRRSPPARRQATRRGSVADDELEAALEKAARRRGRCPERGVGEMFLQLNRLLRAAARQAAGLRARPRARASPIRRAPKRTSPSRSPRSTRGVRRRRAIDIAALAEIDRALELQARLGARGAPESRDPRAASRRRRGDRVPAARSSPPIRRASRPPARSRSSTSSRSATPRRARCSRALWDGDRNVARIRVRRRRASRCR